MSYSDQEPMDNSVEDTDMSKSSKHTLLEYADEKNIYSKLSKEELQDIAGKVLFGYTEDKTSQEKWMMDTDESLKLAKLTKEPKNTPLPQSANIKFPLITTACCQFAARTYPELIQDGKIVKTEIAGPTNPLISLIAEGVATHMSHQLLGSDSEWEVSMDKLLTVLPNIGFVVKKTYYDVLKKKNVSDVCYYKDIVLRNDPCVSCLNDLRRITHILHVHPNDLIESCRAGLYEEECVLEILNFYSTNNVNPECTLYEQHRFLDLDGDNYEEPYIVTVHKETNKVLRIVARYTKDDIEFVKDSKDKVLRINPIQYFTDYHFLPAPDGSFMSVGFGSLLLHSNQTINTIFNQLVDAGTLSNLQTGFIDSRIKVMGGQTMVDPGTWIKAKGVIGQNLKDGFMPITYKEPSNVLFQLLGLILQAAKELTSSTDAIQGLQNATNVPATSMLAMIEQGLKLYSAIQRRMYRGLKDEFQKLYRLNGLYLDEVDYITVLGDDFKQLPNIYKTKAIKVIPIADPNLSSDAQRLAQAQVVMGVASQPGSLVSQYQAQKRMLEAAKVSNIDALLPPELANQPKAPDPKLVDAQMKHQTKTAEVQIKAKAQALKEKEFIAKLSKLEAEITHLQASAVNLVAQAENSQQQSKTSDFNSKLDLFKTKIQAAADAHKQLTDHNIEVQKLRQQQQDLDQSHQREVMALQQNQQDLDQTHQQDMANNERQDNSSNVDGMDQSSSNSGNEENS